MLLLQVGKMYQRSVNPFKRVLHQTHLPKGVGMDRLVHSTCQTAFLNDVSEA